MDKKNNLKGSLILCLAALIWGLAFVAQSNAADKIPPFAINAGRSLIAFAVIAVFFKIMARKSHEKLIPQDSHTRKLMLAGSLICGTLLAVSTNLQQSGISVYPKGVPSEARAGFLTALYVIIVPILSVFFAKKIHPAVWGAILMALGGVYLLCFTGGIGNIYLGDILMLLCAVSFSFHIIFVDKYCNALGGVRLSCIQFLVCGLISLICSVIFEFGKFNFSDIMHAAPQILYLGVMSSGVAYTLQIVGQKFAEPAVASISMSLESVFAALGGWVIAGNALSVKEIFGCLLVFIAITTAQTPDFFKKKQ